MEDKILDLDIKRYKNLVMIDILHQSPCITPALGDYIKLYDENNYRIETANYNSIYADALFINKDSLGNKVINKKFDSAQTAI